MKKPPSFFASAARDAMSDITESHGGAPSDNEDADSFATANLRIAPTKESADSSTSTLTNVSVCQSLSAAENDEMVRGEKVIEVKETKSVDEINEVIDAQQDVVKEDEDMSIVDNCPGEAPEKEGSMKLLKKEFPVKDLPERESPGPDSSASQVRDAPLKSSQTKELHPKESPMKTTPGSVVILKRNEKIGQNMLEITEDAGRPGSAASPELKSKDIKTQKTKPLNSKTDNEKLLAQFGISSSTKSASVSDEKGPKAKVMGKENDNDDLYSFLSLSSASKSSSVVETGDLLGLDFSSSTPSKEQKPAYQDVSMQFY